MASAYRQQDAGLAPEEYLRRERSATAKSEYFHGLVYSMAGSSPEHGTITFNLAGELFAQLEGKPCRGFSSDMKIRTDPDGLYAYPDLSVVCGEPRFHDEHRDVLINPFLIVEVLSPSKEAYDRGRKFAQYQRIDELKDYILVAQDEPRIEHFTRRRPQEWHLTIATGFESTLSIASIGCELRLSRVYRDITFQEEEPRRMTPTPQSP